MSGQLAIETRGLRRRFGATLAVDDLDLEVPVGKVTAFLGPNGAGKTTTIRMILGLLGSDGGDVLLFGQPLRERRAQVLRRVGALVETPSLYAHLSGRENLELTRRVLGVGRQRTDEVLEILDLVKDAERTVGGYSLGMRQRLGLALALLGEPDLLILDEPTNGLDPMGIREMRRLICRLAEELGVTVFLSSHLLAEVEQTASRVTILRGGRRLFQGSLDEFRRARSEEILVGVDRTEEAQRWLLGRGHGVVEEGERLRVKGQGKEAAGEICSLLVTQGFRVHHLSVESSSLESAFLGLTGPMESDRPAEEVA